MGELTKGCNVKRTVRTGYPSREGEERGTSQALRKGRQRGRGQETVSGKSQMKNLESGEEASVPGVLGRVKAKERLLASALRRRW